MTSRRINHLKASEMMVTPVKCVKEDASFKEIIALLSETKFHGVPVVNEEREIIGIVTERDVLQALFLNKEEDGTLVKDIMSKDVVTAEKSAFVVAVAKAMLNKDVTRIPITEESGKLVGIITQHDIIRKMLESGVVSIP